MRMYSKVVRAVVATAVACATLAALPTAAGAASRTVTGRFITLQGGQDLGFNISGVASLRRTKHSTYGRVMVRGLTPDVVFAAHVHSQACSDNMAGGHYRDDPNGAAAPPNELWLSSSTNPTDGILANSHGVARGTGSAPWVARRDAVSIVIHFILPGGNTSGGTKIACADLG